MKNLQMHDCLGARTFLSFPSGRVSTSCMSMVTVLVMLLWSSPGWSFCGFYVSGASGTLSNTTTQAVLLREGKRTVLSMQNNYQGPAKDFAMVVPVPVILQKENVKTLKPELFAKLDTLTSPRLVEYWEQDPCRHDGGTGVQGFSSMGMERGINAKIGGKGRASADVSVEARFEAGEYKIVILGAKDSGGLESWLKAQKYNIPDGAAAVLAPYVSQGMYFFVARVNAKKVKFVRKKAELSPLRFHYDSDEFSLPVRLGMLNANGPQDLVVHILARGSRYRVKNRPNVAIPTNLRVSSKVKKDFGGFYAALFEQTQAQNPGAVVTEYAWSTAKCDPCPGPVLEPNDLYAFGVDTLTEPKPGGGVEPRGPVHVVGRLRADAIHKVHEKLKPSMQYFYRRERALNPELRGRIDWKYTIESSGQVRSVQVVRNTTQSLRLGGAMVRLMERQHFPPFKGDGVAVVWGSWRVDPNAGPLVLPRSFLGGWSVTRLHTRYDARDLSDDLMFEPAPPLVGGRGMPVGVKGDQGLTATALEGVRSAFQARYIVLNPWKGKVACANPRRGFWGLPPASKVRNVRRGGVGLKTSEGLNAFVVDDEGEAFLLDNGGLGEGGGPSGQASTPSGRSFRMESLMAGGGQGELVGDERALVGAWCRWGQVAMDGGW